jgi:copper chaperone CopZ
MNRIAAVFGLLVGAVTGCQPAAPTAETVARPVAATVRPGATGPRWVVVKAEGLSCATCAGQIKGELEKVAGLSQIETFAPSPYCRFYVEDGGLNVQELLDRLAETDSALAGWMYVRGG